MDVLFLAKRKPFSEDAAELISKNFASVDIIFGDPRDKFPQHVIGKKYDYVVSYISPWIVPEVVLNSASKAAINFHPGPPEYPGIGCTNFAIYDEVKEFGITVHHMAPQVDTGEIILVERFPLFEKDSVYMLTQRCYVHIFVAFIKLFPLLLGRERLPVSGDMWQRKPFRRCDLDELCKLVPGMSSVEVGKRIRATEYPGMPGAYWVEERA